MYSSGGAVILSFIINYALGFIMGNALEATWLLMGTLQLMSVIPLVSIYVATSFWQFCQRLLPLHGIIGWIPNPFVHLSDSSKERPYSESYELMSFNSHYLVVNLGANF